MSTSLSLSLCRVAAVAAAAPSARGGDPRRLSLRLPGPGRGSVAGSGFRGVGFTFTFTCLSMAPRTPPKPKFALREWDDADAEARAKAKQAALDADPKAKAEFEARQADIEAETRASRDHLPLGTYALEGDEFLLYYDDLCLETEKILTPSRNIYHPLDLSEEESAVQNKLKEIAQRCMDLLADAMCRLSLEQRRPLYLVFRTVHMAFAIVKARAVVGHAKWWVSSLLLVDKLNVLRKMVSSACNAPLPLDTDDVRQLPPLVDEAIAGLGGVDSNNDPLPQEAAFALVEYTYNTVKSDIDEMITASDATSTTT